MPEKERLYSAHYHAKMVQPVVAKDLHGCEYFTVMPSGGRFQMRGTEFREMVNDVPRNGQSTIKAGIHVGELIGFDKHSIKVRMFRFGLAWDTRINFTDITMYDYAEKC